jgi:hypothetical protein
MGQLLFQIPLQRNGIVVLRIVRAVDQSNLAFLRSFQNGRPDRRFFIQFGENTGAGTRAISPDRD